jgi:hypothetical protein
MTVWGTWLSTWMIFNPPLEDYVNPTWAKYYSGGTWSIDWWFTGEFNHPNWWTSTGNPAWWKLFRVVANGCPPVDKIAY